MIPLPHSWAAARSNPVQRSALGALASCAIVLVALEWNFPGPLYTTPDLPTILRPLDIEPQLRAVMPLAVKPRPPVVVAPSSRVVAAEPEPRPSGQEVPGPVGSEGEPAPDSTATAVGGSSGGSAPLAPYNKLPEVRPYFADDCGALVGVERDQCTYVRMLAHVRRHFRVPHSVRSDLDTRVDFVVDAQGRVTNVQCTPAVASDVQREIERVLRTMDRLEPGRQGELAVPVNYRLPLVLRVR